MKLISIRPQILMFEDFTKFAEEFKPNEDDLIFTHEFLYDLFMKPLNLKCSYLFQERFGIGEPSDIMVNSIFNEAKTLSYSRVIAVGGGTIIDIGKLLSLKLPEDVLEFFNGKTALRKQRELVLIPTTCGTGSEATNITILEITSRQTKQGLGNDELYADKAVLIPALIKDLPYDVFMHSSIDALVHATESFVAPRSSMYTELFAIKAIRLIINGYRMMIKEGKEYRKQLINDFALASNCAGIAFGNTGVGAVHALAMTFGGAYHVPHGEANYEFLIGVFKQYMRKNRDGKIKVLNGIIADALQCADNDKVYDNFENLMESLIKRKPLKEYGLKKEDITPLADKVISGQQRLLVNNYVPLTSGEVARIVEDLY